MKFLIVCHHDADGSAGAAVLFKKLKQRVGNETVIEIVADNLSTHIDWSQYHGYATVFIVDHPYVPELFQENGDIVWLDHHKSSFIIDNDAGEFNIEGIRSASMSGCELAWLYCYGSAEDQDYVASYPKTERADGRIAEIRKKAPIFIQIIGDNDNWDKKLTKEFRNDSWLLFVASNAIPGIKEFNHTTREKDCIEIWTRFLNYSNITDFTELLTYGDAVSHYNKTTNMRSIKANLMHASIKELPGARIALLNTDARGSGTFDSVTKEFDIGASFIYNKDGKVTMNFYSLNGKDDYDLSAIAKAHGGGGHAGAAGCTVNKITDVFTIERNDSK